MEKKINSMYNELPFPSPTTLDIVTATVKLMTIVVYER